MRKQVAEVVLEAVSKIMVRKSRSRGYEYTQYYIYIPRLLALDSSFPFKPNEKVVIRIDREKKRLIIEKLPEKA